MKKYIITLSLLISSLLLSLAGRAQHEEDSNNQNYVVLTRKVAQLKPIIMAAEALRSEDGNQFGDFQIILCGKEVEAITQPQKINEFIDMAKQAGVRLVACGFSLKKFEVDTDKVPDSFEVVQNGILHNLQLQKKGYLNLSL